MSAADIRSEAERALKQAGLCAAPEAELLRRGFAVEERPLSVGWARVLARVDLREKRVYLDRKAIESYAAEKGLSEEAVRRRALAHELGHVLLAHLSGAEAEEAADLFARMYGVS